MAKTYIDTVKYVIYAHVEIDGIVEKPDVVGALFGQTEGLLGDELDLRELQKSGRIGRIEVNIEPESGKSIGEIILPSSLDKVDTSVLAAALETVDRVGPCEAKINVTKVEDTRRIKRTVVVGRAQEILRKMITDKLPESKEISKSVRDEAKTAEVHSYGPEKLACGPNILEAENIIVVEGRADVLTLLKCDIKNVLSLQGKIIPKSVVELSKHKSVTAFVDGDRGGDLIIRQLVSCANIEYVTKAPDGKEVEELTKKEVLKSLRNKMELNEFLARLDGKTETRAPYRPREPRRPEQRGFRERPRGRPRIERRPSTPRMTSPKDFPFKEKLSELTGSLKAVLLDGENKVILEADVKDLSEAIEKTDNIHSVVFDGIITQRLVDLANEKNIKQLVAIKQGRVRNNGEVRIFTQD